MMIHDVCGFFCYVQKKTDRDIWVILGGKRFASDRENAVKVEWD